MNCYLRLMAGYHVFPGETFIRFVQRSGERLQYFKTGAPWSLHLYADRFCEMRRASGDLLERSARGCEL